MSTLEQCSLKAGNVEGMRKTGKSLASTLYSDSTIISLIGELGAGKTTFVQGLADGLGIKAHVVSPSFALEQRYGTALAHIDLYRLQPKDAEAFLLHMEDFPGIKAVEWSERASSMQSDIDIAIREITETERDVVVTFRDLPIPSKEEITSWIAEAMLPQHIVKHMNAVTNVAKEVADYLIARGVIVRKEVLVAAASMHDLLRFVDFKTWDGDDFYTPSDEERKCWRNLREKYGTPHENAAARFLTERRYESIAKIVATHRGMEEKGEARMALSTIEQKILVYADKRVRFDERVSLDERFDDIVVRYGKGTKGDHAKEWRARTKELEIELFPDGPPF